MNSISFNDLNGKVCVITGGAGVLGTAMVKALASVGLKIAIADINKEVADSVAAEIAKEFNATVIGVEANVLDKASLEKAKAVAAESIMIGDDPEVDIRGAKNAGLDQIYVDHVNKPIAFEPTFRVTDLKQLMQIL